MTGYADGARPIAGNPLVRVNQWVARERVAAGFYRYWTPLGVTHMSGDTGRWVLGQTNPDGTVAVLGYCETLAEADGVMGTSVERTVLEMTLAGDAPGLPDQLKA